MKKECRQKITLNKKETHKTLNWWFFYSDVKRNRIFKKTFKIFVGESLYFYI